MRKYALPQPRAQAQAMRSWGTPLPRCQRCQHPPPRPYGAHRRSTTISEMVREARARAVACTRSLVSTLLCYLLPTTNFKGKQENKKREERIKSEIKF